MSVGVDLSKSIFLQDILSSKRIPMLNLKMEALFIRNCILIFGYVVMLFVDSL